MQLPLFRRITTEDLNDAPKGVWKEKLLYAINLFFQQIYSGLTNALTPEQNCIAQTKTFVISGRATPAENVYSFAAAYTYPPLGADILDIRPLSGSTVFTVAPFVSWSYLNGTINIIGICGLSDDILYTITVRFWWAAIINQG